MFWGGKRPPVWHVLLPGASRVVCRQRSRLLGCDTSLSSALRQYNSDVGAAFALLLLVFSSLFLLYYFLFFFLLQRAVQMEWPFSTPLVIPLPTPLLSRLCSCCASTILWYLFVYIYPSVDSCIDKWVDSLCRVCAQDLMWGQPLWRERSVSAVSRVCADISQIVVPYFFTVGESRQTSSVRCGLYLGFLRTWRYDNDLTLFATVYVMSEKNFASDPKLAIL